MSSEILLSGCRQHNLRDLDLSLPAHGLTLITGPSGSGKSSLAFATLHTESRRRYLESLSTSERSRFDHIAPPHLDDATNLPLTVAIRPDSLSGGSRNTLGTESGIIPLLQMLFAARADSACPDCGTPVRKWESQEIIENLTELPAGTRLQLGFPLQQTVSGAEAINWLQTAGFQRVVHAGKICSLAELPEDKTLEDLVVIVDRIKTGSTNDVRIRESLEVCFRGGQGKCIAYAEDSVGDPSWQSLSLDGREWFSHLFSRERDCLNCGRSLLNPDPSLFRWSSPLGACTDCQGRGWVITNRTKSTCRSCRGARLNADACAYRLHDRSLPELHSLRVLELGQWIDQHLHDDLHHQELHRRLNLLAEIGFAPFSLDCPISSFSASERTSLALCNAAVEPLPGALYLVEEPYSGHPPEDWPKVDRIISQVLTGGAGVCLVQAEEEPITRRLHLDHLIRLGPGSGDEGGRIVSDLPAHDEIRSGAHPKTERYSLTQIDWPWIEQTQLDISVGGITTLSGSLATRPIGFLRECVSSRLSELAEGDSCPFPEQQSLATETRKPHARQTVLSAIQAFGGVRQLLAETDDAKKRNVTAGDLSLHKKEGARCVRCEGTGCVSVDLDFLPEFELPCPECGGSRYESRIHEIRFRGFTLPEIMELTAEEAFRVFKSHHRIQKRLQLLKQVQLGYLRLGQSLTQLSRGERQRIRLAAALAKTGGTKSLLTIEEISNGLSSSELPSILSVLREFTSAGHSVLLIDAHEFWKKNSDNFQKLTPRKCP
ncbi:MAG: hypothetical protein P8M30_11685 [Planctomycetaceae bacterium]|nr:hypothetical protein [Planctomycetaceae bacterium]